MTEPDFRGLLRASDMSNAQGHQQRFATLYDELRRVAQRELRRSNGAMTLGPTTLLHETFLNVAGRECAVFADNRQFMSYAARAMRGLIIDYLRSRHAEKRGGGLEIVSLPTDLPYALTEEGDVLQIEKLSTALESLAQIDPRLAECVDLKYFCGFSSGEIAQLRQVSERTVERDWDRARLLLNRFITDREDGLKSAHEQQVS